MLFRSGELSKGRYWIVHGGEGWPSPRGYMPNIPLNRPLLGEGRSDVPFELTEEEEAQKFRAVNAYHTQLQVMSPFLLTFVRTTELYSASPW